MKYLSWDIGIKNLSYCLVEVIDGSYKILEWEIINIGEKIEPIPICQGIKKNKEPCNKKSFYYNQDFNKFCCKTHSKDYKCQMIEVSKIKCCYIDKGKMCNKKVYYEKNNNKYVGYCSAHFKKKKLSEEEYSKVQKKKDKQNEFEMISENLIKELDSRPFLLDIDTITIENQPAFKNPKMKSIQMIIYTYFLIRGRIDNENNIKNILFLSASNKLKIELYLGNNDEEKINKKKDIEKNLGIKDKYKRNKELAKIFCIEMMSYFTNKDDWEEIFLKHKKRDDLADTFLMNIYQIQHDKL
jgi:hypothetical protein